MQPRHWAACSAANQFLNVPARKDQVGLVEQGSAPVPLQGLAWVRAVFVVRCIQRASIPRVRLDRVLEFQGVPVLELLVQGSASLLEWRRPQAQAIAHRADMHSDAAEITATKSRRKAQ